MHLDAVRHGRQSRRGNRTAFGLSSVLLVLTVVVSACGAGTANSATAMSASSLMSLALRNAMRAGFVHEEVSSSGSGQRLSMDNDIGANEGRQIIDFDGGHAKVIELHRVVYIQGDANAVNNYFQIFTTDPQSIAGRWISITPTDSGYLNASSAVTLKSDFSEIVIKGPLREGSISVLNGQKVIEIIGHDSVRPGSVPVSATLYVTATGTVLPVEFHTSNMQDTDTTKWSGWGHRVALVAPKNAVPLARIDG